MRDRTEFDQHQRRCPMLGHDITFHYCRTTGQETLCRKILDCWFETFDVQSFIQAHYIMNDYKHILEPPKQKVATLYELILQAKKRIEPTEE